MHAQLAFDGEGRCPKDRGVRPAVYYREENVCEDVNADLIPLPIGISLLHFQSKIEKGDRYGKRGQNTGSYKTQIAGWFFRLCRMLA